MKTKALAITLLTAVSFGVTASEDIGDWTAFDGKVTKYETKELFGKPSTVFAVALTDKKSASTLAFAIDVGKKGCDSSINYPKQFIFLNGKKAQVEIGCFTERTMGLVVDDSLDSFTAISYIKMASASGDYMIQLKKAENDPRPLYYSSKGLLEVLEKVSETKI